MSLYKVNNPLYRYTIEVFTRFSKQIDSTIVGGRLCLQSDSPLLESITLDAFDVVSASLREVGAKAKLAIELNAEVSPMELNALCADICQKAKHRQIRSIAQWRDRHELQ
jgi:hypothetical protein